MLTIVHLLLALLIACPIAAAFLSTIFSLESMGIDPETGEELEFDQPAEGLPAASAPVCASIAPAASR